MGTPDQGGSVTMSVLLLAAAIGLASACGPLSIPSGNTFCATQTCSHIYNGRACSYWNPAQCTGDSSCSCPGDYTPDSTTAPTKCFKLRTGATSWTDASTQCLANGDARLATIKSAAENAAVAGIPGLSENSYIGLSDKSTEGTFMWTDGSALGSYTNWVTSNSANDATKDCVKFRNNDAAWLTAKCDTNPAPYICEKRPTC